MDDPQKRREDAAPALQDDRLIILNEALCCFARNGYFNTTFKEIAKETGLSQQTIGSIFASKDEILAEYLQMCDDEIVQQIKEETASDTDVLERIQSICVTTLIYLGTHSELTAIWVEFYKHHVARVVLKKFFGLLRTRISEQIIEGMENGVIRQANATHIVEAIVELFEGTLILSRLEGTNNEVERRFLASWEVMVEGLVQK
ncbi:HTH-type transcriptional regulator BetI [Pseudovibrio sp. Ad13]|uniref:TetR/AcrR family transcriptional regulator n=1 Tax=unclassified Pseudovibrio TaxID=2627060 RepID=UPI0007AE8584|nr:MULTISPECIES: TetR/AcrR family transcriptional regulator [unclassified Pseudovibrio]KZK75974.1 HTH-type transcriptional regulator BetI [Pseudovibrio sp. Ad13]KZK91027.1 HTH-type transcriptional regulator BetI [Pseudovibrio sp. Ad5]